MGTAESSPDTQGRGTSAAFGNMEIKSLGFDIVKSTPGNQVGSTPGKTRLIVFVSSALDSPQGSPTDIGFFSF